MSVIHGGLPIEGSAQRIRRVSVALADGDGAGELLAWENPEGVRILLLECLLDLTTKADGASTADVGIAADGTTSDDSIFDGIDTGTAAAIFRDASPTLALEPGEFVTGSKASGDVTGLAGRVHILYILDE